MSLSLVVVWFWHCCELLVFLCHETRHFVRDRWACCERAGTRRGNRAVLQRCLVLGPREVGLAGARAGWPCPLAPSCLESRLWGGAALPGLGVLLVPDAPMCFHGRNGCNSWFGGLTVLLPPPVTGSAPPLLCRKLCAAQGSMGNTGRARGHCTRGCRSDPKGKQGTVNQKDSNKTC